METPVDVDYNEAKSVVMLLLIYLQKIPIKSREKERREFMDVLIQKLLRIDLFRERLSSQLYDRYNRLADECKLLRLRSAL